MRIAAIIVAAGRGTRAGGPAPKQWQSLAGQAVAQWTLDRFAMVETRVLVIHPEDAAQANALRKGDDVRVVHGGASRCASVRAGLEALAGDLAGDLEADPPDRVLIHDIARPCVSAGVINNVLRALDHAEGAAPALAVTDALWTGSDGMVTGVQPREGLFRAQTPQGFRFDAILSAHRARDDASARAAPADDDVAVARAAGMNVAIVEGSEDNLKITGPADFARAAAILEKEHGHSPR